MKYFNESKQFIEYLIILIIEKYTNDKEVILKIKRRKVGDS